MDALTMAISQGSLRRGSAACYLPIDVKLKNLLRWEDQLVELNRKALNLHHGVLVSDIYEDSETDEQAKKSSWWIYSTNFSARNLWIRLLTARMKQESLIFVYWYNNKFLNIINSNLKSFRLCSEIIYQQALIRMVKIEQQYVICHFKHENTMKKDDPNIIKMLEISW